MMWPFGPSERIGWPIDWRERSQRIVAGPKTRETNSAVSTAPPARPVFDRTTQDIGNIVEFGHVNVRVPDQRLAIIFYVMGLGLTREQVMNDVLLAAQPTKRFVTPEEVGALAVFLCREEAKSITGANLSNANLTGANLTGADLTYAVFSNANMTNVVYSNTTCPDTTNSDANGGTCAGHGGSL